MRKIKAGKNKILKFYSLDEVFKKASKKKEFQKSYNEEWIRLKLARQLRELRLKKNLTQKEVAKKAKMPQSVIARIEGGKSGLSLGTLGRLAKVFDREIQLA